MTWRACFRIVPVALLAVAAGWTLAAPVAAIDTSAVAAAKASPELVGAISKQIGATPEQAAGAAGVLFGLAKSRLKADDFSKISKAVPGMALLLKAAPSAAAASGSPTDALSQLAGTVGSIPAVAAKFSKLGLKPEMVPLVVSTLTSFVTKSGGAGLGALLAGALK
jgi:hypothetical protein